MILAIDIGNTNITMGAYDGEKLRFISRLATDQHRTGDQYAVEVRDILDLNGCTADGIEGAIISTVVPGVGTVMRSAVQKLCGIVPMMIGPGIRTGLNIRIDNPAQLGADLVAGAVAAVAKYPMPCIVFDLGTATTVSVLDKDGNMLGGAIAAGPATTLEALATHTAQLPYISIEAPDHVIGSNTIDSMKSGIVIGAAAMLDGMALRIERELGQSATLVATGGLAGKVIAECEREIILDDNLLLEGLRIIYAKNSAK
jgi:type III pantothenate kinase